MVGTGIICLFMATFMSHTATASLLIPIIAVVGVNMGDNLAPMGGVTALLVSVAFASSLGMSLPISTPPTPWPMPPAWSAPGEWPFPASFWVSWA